MTSKNRMTKKKNTGRKKRHNIITFKKTCDKQKIYDVINIYFCYFQSTDTNGGNQFLEFDGYIDLGKQLSVLHSLLTESLEKCPQVSYLHLFIKTITTKCTYIMCFYCYLSSL